MCQLIYFGICNRCLLPFTLVCLLFIDIYVRSYQLLINHTYQQAHSQKLLLGGSFGQNVDLFYKTVDLLNEIEDIFSKNVCK